MYILSYNWHIKSLIVNKFLDVLAERFSQDPLESYFCKEHPPGARIGKLPSMTLVMPRRNEKVFKPKVRDQYINFESNRTISMSEKKTNKTIIALSNSFKQPSDT